MPVRGVSETHTPIVSICIRALLCLFYVLSVIDGIICDCKEAAVVGICRVNYTPRERESLQTNRNLLEGLKQI